MTVGIRPDDLRRRNRAMVISAVRRLDQPSRTEIAAITGLSHSTISAISSGLIAEGALSEGKGGDNGTAKRGRPQIALTLNPAAASVIAVVFGLNSLSSALIDYEGRLVREDRLRLPTLKLSGDDLIAEMIASIARLDVRPSDRVLRISVAVQGTTDAKARAMLWSPVTAGANIALSDRIEAAYGVPVTVENDCNMMAEALRWRDQAIYRDNFVAILLSDGIGMGLFHKGQLFTGTHSSGGEFGHMVLHPDGALCRCGRRGCIEAYAGNYAIWREAHRLSADTVPDNEHGAADMQMLAETARAVDGPERAAFRAAGEAVGFGLGSLFALIDAAPVAIVGAGAAAFDLIETPMREAISKTAGGEHADAISFKIYADELPLIREGCAMRALAYIDTELFSVGGAPAYHGNPPAAAD